MDRYDHTESLKRTNKGEGESVDRYRITLKEGNKRLDGYDHREME